MQTRACTCKKNRLIPFTPPGATEHIPMEGETRKAFLGRIFGEDFLAGLQLKSQAELVAEDVSDDEAELCGMEDAFSACHLLPEGGIASSWHDDVTDGWSATPMSPPSAKQQLQPSSHRVASQATSKSTMQKQGGV